MEILKIKLMRDLVISSLLIALLFCSCRMKTSDSKSFSGSTITAEMALEGVSNYCHDQYDWSIAEDNPDMMYITGDETESEYKVVFRSYTGAFVYFYVDKASGTTRMVEHVPALDIEDETGSFNLTDYITKDKF